MTDHRRFLRLRDGHEGVEQELDDELRAHIEMRVEELMASGMEEGDARREAERRFGELESARRELYASARRRERRLRWRGALDDLGRDFRLAARRAGRSPGYAAASVSIFALGIALTTVMFTLVDHVLLRPLPFPGPDRLVSLQSMGESREPFNSVSMANWYDWREGSSTLAATAITRVGRWSVVESGEAFRVTGATTVGDFFGVFRPRLVAGRALTAEDGQKINQVTVVSSAFARLRFGTADGAIGRALDISGRSYEVVGVVAPGQAFPEEAEMWTAAFPSPGSGALRNNIGFEAYGRLRPDVDRERAREELDRVAQGIRESDPEGANYSYGVGVLPLRDVLVSGAEDELWMLMAAVLGVLLAACANLAGLGLARAGRRSQEVAVRIALGSGRGRVVREVLAEHLLLALIGGAAGLGLAWVGGTLLFDRLALLIPRAGSVSIDLPVGLFATGISIAAGLLAGVGPALRASRLGAPNGARGAVRGGRGLPGGALVGTEVALTVALLVGGGLLLRSFRAVVSRDLGFDPEGVVTADIQLTSPEYLEDFDGTRSVEFWKARLAELKATPGIVDAAVANWIPTGPSGTSFLAFPGRPEPDYGGGYHAVSDDYFDALGIRLLQGRTFDPSDDSGTARVALVGRTLAERAWPGRSAVGQLIGAPSMEAWMYDGDPPWLTVIGVVDDVRQHGYEGEPRPELYVLYRQATRWARSMSVVMRARPGTEEEAAEAVRALVRGADPSIAVEIGMLDARVSDLLRERVVIMRLLNGFALAALLLTCLGIYGLVAHAASLQTRELAVRAALGAKRSGLLRHMLTGAGRIIVAGAGAGLVVAYGGTGLVESLIVDVPATDPISYAGAAALLVALGLAAALVPSIRAARLDPVEALRSE